MKFSRRTLARLADAIGADTLTNAQLDALFYEFHLDQFDDGASTKLRRGLALVKALETHFGDAQGDEVALEILLRVLKLAKLTPRMQLVAALEIDGFRYESGRLLPTTPGAAALGPQISAFEADLQARNLTVAARHYRQAVDNFIDGNYEACNGQLRSSLEDFIVGISNRLTNGNANNPRAALQQLRGQNKVDTEEFNLLRSFWDGIQDNGPHAGLSEPDEALFRLHVATAVGRYLVSKT